ncbi:MAG: DUF3990 domain-containing protein [Bacteroidales bacterium]|nr:DUF3990 domain-containing protein [Bacteroidales bacterium]
MEIYHGSYIKIESPKIITDVYTKDFGVGFYCTIIKEQARRWAMRYKDNSVVNVYNCQIDTSLFVKDFGPISDEWLDFVVDCRAGKSHSYDIVIGAMADDQIYNYVNDYIAGNISREQFWVLAKFKYPTHQIAFCSQESLKCLKFVKAEYISNGERG